jgi:hypothetical protein
MWLDIAGQHHTALAVLEIICQILDHNATKGEKTASSMPWGFDKMPAAW